MQEPHLVHKKPLNPHHGRKRPDTDASDILRAPTRLENGANTNTQRNSWVNGIISSTGRLFVVVMLTSWLLLVFVQSNTFWCVNDMPLNAISSLLVATKCRRQRAG